MRVVSTISFSSVDETSDQKPETKVKTDDKVLLQIKVEIDLESEVTKVKQKLITDLIVNDVIMHERIHLPLPILCLHLLGCQKDTRIISKERQT